MYIRPIIGPHPWDPIMHIDKFIWPPVVVRQASFGAGEIPSGAISDGRKLAKGSLAD